MTRPRAVSWREHGVVSLAFVASRIALAAAGLRMTFALDWMFLSDPAELAQRLLATAFYFHAYPPGMDLLTGFILKLAPAHSALCATLVFWAFDLLLVNALFICLRVLGLRRRAASITSLAFTLTPAALYFEHLYLYECPVTALLCVNGACFALALRRNSRAAWLGCFATAAAIGWTRSTFHLVWFAALVGLAAWLAPRAERRRVLGAALGPGGALLALYLKNWLVFGFFGASSAAVSNLSIVTVALLPSAERSALIAKHELSPFANISVFAGPEAYRSFFPTSENQRYPPALSRLERPTVHAANYNHWFFLETREPRRRDALYYLREHPLTYVDTVLSGVKAVLGPSTIWHPADTTWSPNEPSPHSPHARQRAVLGPYERAYNAALHSLPFAPMGLYALLPLPCLVALRRARDLTRAAPGRAKLRARAGLLYWSLLQIVYVIGTSSAFSGWESSRYRYAAEPMIWLVTAFALVTFLRASKRTATRGQPSPAGARGRNPGR
jgi:hypothetical protein